MPVDRRDHELRRVLQPQRGFMRVQEEVILERWIDRGQHLDVCAGGEKLIACAREYDDVNIVIHARLEDGLVEMTVHLGGVSVSRRIVHLDHGHAGVGAIVDEWVRGFAGGRLGCGRHKLLLIDSRSLCWRDLSPCTARPRYLLVSYSVYRIALGQENAFHLISAKCLSISTDAN